MGPNGPNNLHSSEEHLWHVGSTTSTVGPSRVARLGWLPSQANLPLHDGWRRNWQMRHCSWNVKSTIRKAELAELPQHNAKLDCIGKTGRYLQLGSFTCMHCRISTQVSVQKLWFLPSCLCCGDVGCGPKCPNDKHRLEGHLWHVGSTTWTVAPLRVARLGWLPSQAKLPLHDGWRRTWQMCQCSWNVKSTIRKAT